MRRDVTTNVRYAVPNGRYETRYEVALYEQRCAVCVAGNYFIQTAINRQL